VFFKIKKKKILLLNPKIIMKKQSQNEIPKLETMFNRSHFKTNMTIMERLILLFYFPIGCGLILFRFFLFLFMGTILVKLLLFLLEWIDEIYFDIFFFKKNIILLFYYFIFHVFFFFSFLLIITLLLHFI